MSRENQSQSSHDPQNEQHQEGANPQKPAIDPSKVVDPRDLVYKGGFKGDPQEILGNPAVAPEMLSEGRDLRVDLFKDAEEANPE